jgi:hypothetical protein
VLARAIARFCETVVVVRWKAGARLSLARTTPSELLEPLPELRESLPENVDVAQQGPRERE